MRIIVSMAAAIALAVAVAGPVSAASGDAYKAKKAECQARAKTMDFGVHLIKKHRWVNDCIAGRHST
jgi:outer membrane lipoprotein SlyB